MADSFEDKKKEMLDQIAAFIEKNKDNMVDGSDMSEEETKVYATRKAELIIKLLTEKKNLSFADYSAEDMVKQYSALWPINETDIFNMLACVDYLKEKIEDDQMAELVKYDLTIFHFPFEVFKTIWEILEGKYEDIIWDIAENGSTVYDEFVREYNKLDNKPELPGTNGLITGFNL